eukprot:CAMPEP_0184861412 /NCGR_PEP_ID=MMETSP0580-20130426/6101_1 /TAXON_ID=1118495 /ORGANISM="Dactyliosolen fragilissimus" /LENGTH=752 /DNA_ID=CAMNT_0027358899 /DNA_START=38 /DNA_END=2296 /DNA_ORIENTATION=+
MNNLEEDDLRHKRDQDLLRKKRKEAKENKSISQIEKENKRKEHVRKLLEAQKKSGREVGGAGGGGGGGTLTSTSSSHKKSSSSSHRHSHSRSKQRPSSSKSSTTSTKSTTETSSSIFQSLFSKRAEGFMIDLNFRNVPPRPPVGPCFVGHGLHGALHEKWARYRPNNAVERFHVWKLHSEFDLGVPLAPSAMDLEGCYVDPEHDKNFKRRKLDSSSSSTLTSPSTRINGMVEDDYDHDEDDEDDNDNDSDNNETSIMDANGNVTTTTRKRKKNKKKLSNKYTLHPDDEALIHWKGSMKDTAAVELKHLRDMARTKARAIATTGKNGKLLLNPQDISRTLQQSNRSTLLSPTTTTTTTTAAGPGSGFGSGPSNTQSTSNPNSTTTPISSSKSKNFKSRVLREANPFFMKKTTYLANDQTQSVHRFVSLAETKKQEEKDIEAKIQLVKSTTNIADSIEESFRLVVDSKNKENNINNNNNNNNTKLRHPNKKHVYAVEEYPLLPDTHTWGYPYTHVVLDKLPQPTPKQKAADNRNNNNNNTNNTNNNNALLKPIQLSNAFITDVHPSKHTKRDACSLLVPDDSKAAQTTPSYDPRDEPTPYKCCHQYDLDVLPLREENAPHTTFVLMIDHEHKVVLYHPITSRVMLGGGRPAKGWRKVEQTRMERRAMGEADVKDMEKQRALVDLDLAKKYNMLEEEGDDGDGNDNVGDGGNANSDDDDYDDKNITTTNLSDKDPKSVMPFGNDSDSSDSEHSAF